MEYLLVGGERIFACWTSRIMRKYLLVGGEVIFACL